MIRPGALAAVTDAQQLTQLTTAVQFTALGGTTPGLYVRGIGSGSANQYIDPAVAVNWP